MTMYNNSTKYLITIKNKWTNSERRLTVSKINDVQLAHKYAYYNHTSNLEDIVSIVDNRKNTVFTLRGGFRKHNKTK